MLELVMLQTSRVYDQIPGQHPDSLYGSIQALEGPSLEQVERGDEVVRAFAALQTADELQQDADDTVPQGHFVPLGLAGMLLTLVEQQSFEDVGGDGVVRIGGKVDVSQRLEDAETFASTAMHEQHVLGLQETHAPVVALHRGVGAAAAPTGHPGNPWTWRGWFDDVVCPLFRQQVEALGLDVGNHLGNGPHDLVCVAGPLVCAPGPDAGAPEGCCDLDDVAILDAKFDLKIG